MNTWLQCNYYDDSIKHSVPSPHRNAEAYELVFNDSTDWATNKHHTLDMCVLHVRARDSWWSIHELLKHITQSQKMSALWWCQEKSGRSLKSFGVILLTWLQVRYHSQLQCTAGCPNILSLSTKVCIKYAYSSSPLRHFTSCSAYYERK